MRRFSFIYLLNLITVVVIILMLAKICQQAFIYGDKSSLTSKEKKSAPILIGLKKRNENLCPNEYRSCWCDYINTNNSVYSKLSSSFSIIIDCQFYSSPSIDSASSRANLSDYRSNMKANSKAFLNKSVLSEIPKIITNLPNKFKYLLHITHLDLSRTNIAEVQTDAFYVNFFISSFF
jgi:hypothetical protein